MTASIAVRDVDAEDLAKCASLYIDVMGLSPDDGSINPRLLAALQANSGTVVGAYDDGELIGFTYSFLARTPAESPEMQRLYQYSQLAVVARHWQGRQVGRALKLGQRQRCLAQGITLMRWVFDPVKARNAHFNLNVLGARVVQLVPSMYGANGFGSDPAEETDRVVVEWDLESEPAAALPTIALNDTSTLEPGQLSLQPGHAILTLPADWEQFRAAHGAAVAEQTRHLLRSHLTRLCGDGWAGIACDVVDDRTAVYRFEPAIAKAAGTQGTQQ